MRKSLRALAVGSIVCAAALTSSMARAAVVNLHSNIDLGAFDLSGSVIDLTGSPPESASFAAGDTLKLDIDFKGNQTLKLGTAYRFTPILTTFGDTYDASGAISLHDFAGALTTVSGAFYCCSFGFNFTTPGYAGSGPIEFSGVTFTFANLTFATPVPVRRTASGVFLEIATYNNGGNGVGELPRAGAAVPEPASWALMILGLGGVGAAIRRQRPRLRFDQ